MSPSLSVVLPVYNAQSELPGLVAELLENLPELTTDFEILIVDDGSTDQTEELAVDMAREFPQIRYCRHAARKGMDAALSLGFAKTRGDIVFVQDHRHPLTTGELRRLWQLRNDESFVALRSPPRPRTSGVVRRLMHWGATLRNMTGQKSGPAPRIAHHAATPPRPLAARQEDGAAPRRHATSFLVHLQE